MNPALVRVMLAQLGQSSSQFLAGWAEGRTRYSGAPDKDVIPGSGYPRGSVAYAASQAAVAFHHALEP
jgi:hypothetical protein